MLRFLNNFGFGTFAGFVLGVSLAWLFDLRQAGVLPDFLTEIATTTVTLFGAALALAGALAAIQTQERHRELDRKKRLEAAKIHAPHALSIMCSVARNGLLDSLEVEKNLTDTSFHGPLLGTPRNIEIPLRVSDTLSTIMANADDQRLLSRVSLLLREHQVFEARLSEYAPDTDGDGYRDLEYARQQVVSWAYLHAIASSLFGWARGDSQSVDMIVDEAEIRSALRRSLRSDTGSSIDTERYEDQVGLYARTFLRRSK